MTAGLGKGVSETHVRITALETESATSTPCPSARVCPVGKETIALKTRVPNTAPAMAPATLVFVGAFTPTRGLLVLISRVPRDVNNTALARLTGRVRATRGGRALRAMYQRARPQLPWTHSAANSGSCVGVEGSARTVRVFAIPAGRTKRARLTRVHNTATSAAIALLGSVFASRDGRALRVKRTRAPTTARGMAIASEVSVTAVLGGRARTAPSTLAAIPRAAVTERASEVFAGALRCGRARAVS